MFRIDIAVAGQPGQKAIADKILVFGAGDADEEAFKASRSVQPLSTEGHQA